MDTEQAKQFILERLRQTGISIVMDKHEMERILGESTEGAYQSILLQKMVLSYTEGERMPDLSPASVSFLRKDGKPQTMYSVRFYGDRPKDYIPQKLGKAYKLMEQWPDGTLHALFAGTQEVYPVNQWNWAKGFVPDTPKSGDKNFKGIQSMNLAPRFGWHMGTGVPSTHHLMGVGDVYHPVMCYPSKTGVGHPKGSKRVWVEVSYDASRDFTPVAEANPSPEKDIRGLVPFGGYYMFQESNLSNWIVASSIRFDRVIPEKERQAILKNAGFDEELVWRKMVLRKHIKSEMTRLLNRMDAKFQKEDTEKLGRLLDVSIENESKIDAQSGGQEPTYPLEELRAMAKTVAAMQQVPIRAGHLLEQLKAQRKDLESSFSKQHPETKRKRLTQEEINETREGIREGIVENPEYLDREAAKHLAIDSKGRVQGFVLGNTIYLDPEQMQLDTPIHEYTHLWDRLCQQENPALWKEGVELMKKTRLWKAVKESPFYQDIAQDDNLVASEVHARLAGLQGAELLKAANGEEHLVKRLQNWGKRFWLFLRGRVAKEEEHVSLEAFVKAPIVDLITHQKILSKEKKTMEHPQPKIEIHTPMDNITSPLMLREGTEIASIQDAESGISGTIWVSDGYDSMRHFVDFQGKRYKDWDSFPKELQDTIRNNLAWKETLGLEEGKNLQEGCFDMMFTDKDDNILIDDTAYIKRMPASALGKYLKGKLTVAKAVQQDREQELRMAVNIMVPMDYYPSRSSLQLQEGTVIAHIIDAANHYDGMLTVDDHKEQGFCFEISDFYGAVLLEEGVSCEGMSADKMKTFLTERMEKFVHERNILEGKEDPRELIPVSELLHSKKPDDFSAKDLMNPEKQDAVIRYLVKDLVEQGKDIDAIDETFSEIKMAAINHAETLTQTSGKDRLFADGRV